MNNETVAARFRFVYPCTSQSVQRGKDLSTDLADNITMNFCPSYKYPRVSPSLNQLRPTSLIQLPPPPFLFLSYICILYKFNLLKMTRIYAYVYIIVVYKLCICTINNRYHYYLLIFCHLALFGLSLNINIISSFVGNQTSSKRFFLRRIISFVRAHVCAHKHTRARARVAYTWVSVNCARGARERVQITPAARSSEQQICGADCKTRRFAHPKTRVGIICIYLYVYVRIFIHTHIYI